MAPQPLPTPGAPNPWNLCFAEPPAEPLDPPSPISGEKTLPGLQAEPHIRLFKNRRHRGAASFCDPEMDQGMQSPAEQHRNTVRQLTDTGLPNPAPVPQPSPCQQAAQLHEFIPSGACRE